MPPVQRLGDPNTAGGTNTSGVGSVRVNNQPIVVVGTVVSPHAPFGRPHPPHAAATTTGGVSSVRAGGIPVNVDGNTDTCGHSRTAGSGDVRAGG